MPRFNLVCWHSTLGPGCGPSAFYDYYQDVEAAVEALAAPEYNLLDFDALVGLTNTNLDDSVRGRTDRSGRFWAEAFEVDFNGVVSRASQITAHEFGHVIGLDDEYCSTVLEPAGSVASQYCNSPASPNAMSATHGCDPAQPTCCDQAFRHPGYPGDYPNDLSPCGGEYVICCLGNSSVANASLPLDQLTNDPVGRCPMSSSLAETPRRFCGACLTHIRNTSPYVCGNTFSGLQRILEVKLISDPGVNAVSLVSYRTVDGRAGWQQFSTGEAGGRRLRFLAHANSLDLGTRAIHSALLSDATEEGVGQSLLLRIPLPDDVAEGEPITMFVEVEGAITSQVTLNGEAPVPVVSDLLAECQGPTGTLVNLDGSGSWDPDGDPLNYLWEAGNDVQLTGAATPTPSGTFPLGDTPVTLTLTDSAGLSESITVLVTVQDTISPLFESQTPLAVNATTCGAGASDILLKPPKATDLCLGNLDVTGTVAGLTIGPNDTGVPLNAGTYVASWTATDGTNQATLAQTLNVLPAVWSTRTFDVRDGARVLRQGQAPAAVVNSGTSYTRLGNSPARIGSVFSRAKVESFGGTIEGDVRVQSSYQGFNGAQITGQVYQWQTVHLPTAPAVPVITPGTEDFVVNTGTLELAPGNYRDLTINSNSPQPTVVITAGTYTFRSLTSNSASSIRVAGQGTPDIRVASTLNYRGGFLDQQGAPAQIRLTFTGAQSVLEGPFRGTLLAPGANVELGMGAQSSMVGQFLARDLLVRPSVTVTCLPSSTLGASFAN